MGKYDDVMQHLHPKVVIEKVDRAHDEARGKYLLRSSVVRSHKEFENICIDYLDHHYKCLFNGQSLPPLFLMDQVRELLEKSEGFDNMVYVALSGAEGGIGHVLNVISEGYKYKHKKAYFEYIINTFIDPLDFSQVVELCRELQNRLSNFSPQSMNYISPEQMAADFKKILWRYIDTLTKHRNLWAY